MRVRSPIRCLLAVASGLLINVAAAAPAAAAEIAWTDWTGVTASAASGSASGEIPGLDVSVGYSGQFAWLADDVNWQPASSFIGGVIENLLGPVDGLFFAGGPNLGMSTITFDSPVVDPVFGVWSLGHGVTLNQFLFSSPFTALGNEHSGGLIQFTGTFTSISWTNTVKDYYFLTVGVGAASAPGVPGTPGVFIPGPDSGLPSGVIPTPVVQSAPEPATLVLLGAGLTAIAMRQRRMQRRKQ